MRNKVTVIGLGYIGLPTAALLANSGFDVEGFDISESVVSTINKGKIHIIENDLEDLVFQVVQNNSLRAVNKVNISDVYIICVPTPLLDDEGMPFPDITYIESAIKNISSLVKPGDIIILESTSPVGTTQKIKDLLDSLNVDTSDISIAYCPERVLPGNILYELIHNDRVVGGIDEFSTDKAVNFYKKFVKGSIFPTTSKTAEMCKLTENSFRDVNIAFANELSIICQENNINVWELIEIANKHPRVNILQPGSGVGGHCIAVDPWFIVAKNPTSSTLIKTAREVNNHKPLWIKDASLYEKNRLNSLLKKEIYIGILGISFKPDIDDLRESPALEIANLLKKEYKKIFVCEPNISEHEDIEITSFDETIDKCDLLVVLQKHSVFIQNKNKIENDKYILDFCGLFKEELI